MPSDSVPQERAGLGASYRRTALAAAIFACLAILLLVMLLHPSSLAVDSVYGGF